MARRSKEVVIDPKTGGRDAGKIFTITEKSALAAERWAKRALAAIGRTNAVTGVDPSVLDGLGLIGVAAVGVRALATLDDPDSEQLMSEMLACIEYHPNSKDRQMKRALDIRKGDCVDIEEVRTIWDLRREVLELHLGFSLAAVWSKLELWKTTAAATDISNAQTSQEPSPSSSAPDLQP